jgi:DNA modification methylase
VPPYWTDGQLTIYCGDSLAVLRELPDETVNCVVTSPPYWGLRDYGVEGQMGQEKTPAEYVANLTEVFREVRRVMRSDGTAWVNMGDCYNGSGAKARQRNSPKQMTNRGGQSQRGTDISGLKPKDLVGMPWRLAFALQADGWYLRQDIIWHKPNPMPESVRDRCTKAHEYVFLLTKAERYYWNDANCKEPFADARMGNPGKHSGRYPRESGRQDAGPMYRGQGWNRDGTRKGRNRRSVWTIIPKPFKDAHFATYPPELVRRCLSAGCPPDGTVLDPFNGAGTTLLVAGQMGLKGIGIDLSEPYCKMAVERLTRGLKVR